MLKINSTAVNALFDVGYHMRLNDVFMSSGMMSSIQTYEQKL